MATSESEVSIRGLAELWTGRERFANAAVNLVGSQVVWVGPSAEAPRAETVVDATGLVGMPGLVDPHTHTTFAGSRAGEFERRLGGEAYTAILESGGGIHATVAATRAASEAELVALTRARLAAMLRLGVTTVEIKSGYGLTAVDEAKMLRAARAAAGPVEVVTTFLGAHARPPGRRDYVDEVIEEQLPACAPFADGIDVYCDRGAFTLEETASVLRAGRARGLGIRVHAEQVEHTGAAALAASLGALSADHLERLDEAGAAAMGRAGTVAVLLPGAMVYLRDTSPPIDLLRRHGVSMAVGTDFNPGSSPVRDLWACATLACVTMRLTVAEALAGITTVAARAVGRPDRGWLGPGSRADLALFAPPPGEPAELRTLIQYMGGHVAEQVWVGGRRVI